MEEDIEILESFIKEVVPEYEKVRIGCEEYEIPILPIKFKPTKEIAQAIENLINRVKELEEKNRLLQNGYDKRVFEIIKAEDEAENLKEENEELKEQIVYLTSTNNKDILKYWRKK